MAETINESTYNSDRHEMFYLSCGPEDGTPIIFVHGWPDLAIGWEQQLLHFGKIGFRAIAPDMRGYGRSTIYPSHDDYTIRKMERDLTDLADHLGIEKAIWVGHDWGTPMVWSMAQQYPNRCFGNVGIGVPYMPPGFTLDEIVRWSDRKMYPEEQFPFAQWDYWKFYQTNFEDAKAAFEANVENTVRALFRSAIPEMAEYPSMTATVTARGGWFGPDGAGAPPLPRDKKVLSESHEQFYVEALERNGFSGPDAWYLNDDANRAYAHGAKDNWILKMPILFIHARHDFICATIDTPLVEPMRSNCTNLSEEIIDAGHWVAQEKPDECNHTITNWLSSTLGMLK